MAQVTVVLIFAAFVNVHALRENENAGRHRDRSIRSCGWCPTREDIASVRLPHRLFRT